MKKEKKHTVVSENPYLELDTELFKNEEWLTTEEVMKYLKTSRSTIYRLRKRQIIPSLKVGNMPMYPKLLLNRVFLSKALHPLKRFKDKS